MPQRGVLRRGNMTARSRYKSGLRPLFITAGIALSSALGALMVFTSPGQAQDAQKPLEESGEVLLQAEELLYNRDTKVVTAQGNVEIVYGPRILFADRVIYEQEKDIVTAKGNVRILEPTGDVLFADSARLTDQMKDGFVDSLSVLMVDNTRVASVEARRTGGNVTTFHKGVFSPCDVCKAEPDSSPLWQIKSYKVIHNQKEQQILYEDAFFEFFGVPVAYMPFFSHADPTVERQSGFLFPSISTSSDLGYGATIPYYWVIAPNMDATFSPRYMSEQGLLLETEFRHRTNRGKYEFTVTGTKPQEPEEDTPADTDFRGSFFSNGAFTIDQYWDWGFRTELTTDDTYLRRYGYDWDTDLTSTAFVRRQDGRNQFLAETFFFQGLLSRDVSAETPTIWPLANYHFEPEQEVLGGNMAWDTNFMVLTRARGTDSQRISSTVEWESRHITSTGEIFRPFVDLRGDLYFTDEVQTNTGETTDENLVGRALPMAGLEWRWPWVGGTGSSRQVIEPVVQLIAAPNGGNPEDIPNEDSQSFEFDDINLFDPNRFPGYDRWEGGSRANVGVNFSVYGENGGRFDALLGQTFRLRENTDFDAGSGLRDQKSDYVGRLRYAPSENFSITQRFRISQSDFAFERNELDFFSRIGPFSANATYAYFAESQSATLGTREEISGGASYRIDTNWSLRGYTRRDLTDGQTLQNLLGLRYQDECFALDLNYRQNFYRDRDIEPDTTVMLQLTFKHLGTTGFTSSLGSNTEEN